jgi:hypothetical protein
MKSKGISGKFLGIFLDKRIRIEALSKCTNKNGPANRSKDNWRDQELKGLQVSNSQPY